MVTVAGALFTLPSLTINCATYVPGLSAVKAGFTVVVLLSIAVLPTGTLLAGHAGGILRSADAGGSWKPALTGPGVQWVALDAQGAAYGYAWGGTVYRSTDDGATWTPVVRGRPGVYATAFGVTPGGALLITTTEGMYRAVMR